MESQNNTDSLSKELQTNKNATKRKKLIFKSFLLVFILIVAGAISYKYMNTTGPKSEIKEKEEVLYLELDPIIVNLDTRGGSKQFLKISITLKLKNQASFDLAKKLEPSLKDECVTFLRQLRPSDVFGSVAVYRLKDNLYSRTNKVLYPEKIEDLLIEDILVQ